MLSDFMVTKKGEFPWNTMIRLKIESSGWKGSSEGF